MTESEQFREIEGLKNALSAACKGAAQLVEKYEARIAELEKQIRELKERKTNG